jgi:sugar phosphate isomerase/epimerase
MSTPDPFVTFDAAYVLGALSPQDSAAFEAHLGHCERCARSVRELTGLPGLLAHAADRGVVLSLEPEPGMLVETVDDALRLRADLGDPPGLGLTVDVGHCLVVEPDGPDGALRRAAPYLRNVQLDDMPSTHHEHRPFGAGDLDLAAVMATLREIGYDGVAAVELPRHGHDAPRLARESLAAIRSALKEATR